MKLNRYYNFVISSLLLAFGVLFLSSCVSQMSSHEYVTRQVGEVCLTYAGKIKSMRAVCVSHGDQLENNELGIMGGGLAGGILGNAVGRGRFVPTAVGAVAGAVTGSLIEKRAKQQTAFEYIVELDQGGLMTIVQGPDQYFCIGQPVYVIVSQTGRSRIAPM